MRQLRCEEGLKSVSGAATPRSSVSRYKPELRHRLPRRRDRQEPGQDNYRRRFPCHSRSREFEPLACWDHVVSGEGEKALPILLDKLAAGDGSAKMIAGSSPEDLDQLPTPTFPKWGQVPTLYALEVARGCPALYLTASRRKEILPSACASARIDHVLREVEQAHARYSSPIFFSLDVNATTRRSISTPSARVAAAPPGPRGDRARALRRLSTRRRPLLSGFRTARLVRL